MFDIWDIITFFLTFKNIFATKMGSPLPIQKWFSDRCNQDYSTDSPGTPRVSSERKEEEIFILQCFLEAYVFM